LLSKAPAPGLFGAPAPKPGGLFGSPAPGELIEYHRNLKRYYCNLTLINCQRLHLVGLDLQHPHQHLVLQVITLSTPLFFNSQFIPN
jgi:hypothetical protein